MGCIMWGFYIIGFFAIPTLLGYASYFLIDKIWPGMVLGFILDIFLFMVFVKYLRRRRGI